MHNIAVHAKPGSRPQDKSISLLFRCTIFSVQAVCALLLTTALSRTNSHRGWQTARLMSLVSGPGRGGQKLTDLPGELTLAIDQHVKYIQQLDTVRDSR